MQYITPFNRKNLIMYIRTKLHCKTGVYVHSTFVRQLREQIGHTKVFKEAIQSLSDLNWYSNEVYSN